MCWKQQKNIIGLEDFSLYFISVLFLENIDFCAKAHGQIWFGRLQVSLWSACLREWDSSGQHAYGSAARPLRPQIKDGVVLEYIHFQPFQYFRIQNPETVDFGIIY